MPGQVVIPHEEMHDINAHIGLYDSIALKLEACEVERGRLEEALQAERTWLQQHGIIIQEGGV